MTTELTLLPATWETARLTVNDVTLQEVAPLTALYNACSYAEPWDPTFHTIPEAELAELVNESLSNAAEHSRFKLQTIRRKADGALVGYFHLHHGVRQRPELAYISMFVLHPDQQQQQYGSEVVQGISDQLRALGYPAIQLDVYLKNWPALRFWIKQGFTKIDDLRGDRVHSADAHAQLRLEKTL
ncbi:MAG: N-acetyltransferase [Caldilinea sp. CFX5]|nr:N-acetyltransferase [Caldilinea sp. CFX5]